MQTETKTTEELWAEEGVCPKCGWNPDDYQHCYSVTDEREIYGMNDYYTMYEWNEHFICPKCKMKFVLVNGN